MKRFLLRVLSFLLVLLGLCGAGGYWYAQRPMPLATPVVDFTIPAGSSLKQVARIVSEAGVGVSPLFFHWMGRLTGQATLLKAGSYEVTPGTSPWGLLLKLTRGDVSQGELLVIEGWTFRQFRAAVDAHPELAHDTRGLSDAELLQRLGSALGMSLSHPEGRFFPDKYFFDKRSSDLALYRRAFEAMRLRLAAAWETRQPDSPLKSPEELLTLASLVEKETGRAEDRGLVAGVFVNRLRAGMRLQTDPSVIYGLGESFDGNLRRRDLERDGPYNTYLRVGLPPTPIALPGQAALLAAARPTPTDAMYFVARGDGSSQFSRSLDDHNRAVDRYQRGGGK